MQKLDHIVAAALDRLHVLSCLAGNAELIVVPDQPVQPLQTPEEDALLFPQQLIHQKRIVCSACGPVFGGQHDLAAKETVGLVVQGGQRTVAEAEKADIELTLIALNTLALHIHLALGGHDGFDIVGLGQSAHIHIVIYHQELVFQIRTAEPVALHLLDAGGIHAVAQQRAHDKTDAAFTLAALADEHEHLLSLGGWQQTVAEKLLQGGNVLRLQQLGQELQPAFRCRCIRIVRDGQAVVAVALVGGKATVHEIRPVGNMDAVGFNGQRRRIRLQLDAGKQICHNFGQPGGQNSGDFLQNEIADLSLVLDQPVHGEKPPTHTFHGVLVQKLLAEQHFIDVSAVVPVRPRLRCHIHLPIPPCEFSLISVAACPVCRLPSAAARLRRVRGNPRRTEYPDSIPFRRACDRLP